MEQAYAVRVMGRPRNAAHDEAIMAAVLVELESMPYSKLAVDNVARRAGVAKTTLYRRYPTKLELVTAAVERYYATHFFALVGETIDVVVAEALRQLVNEYGRSGAGRALVNLAAEAEGNPELRRVVARPDKHDELRRAFRSAVDRGELRPDADVELMVELVIAVFPYRMLYMRGAIPDDLPERMTSLLLDGVRACRCGDDR